MCFFFKTTHPILVNFLTWGGYTESSAVVRINFVVDINSRMQRSIHNYYLYYFKYTCTMSKKIYNKNV